MNFVLFKPYNFFWGCESFDASLKNHQEPSYVLYSKQQALLIPHEDRKTVVATFQGETYRIPKQDPLYAVLGVSTGDGSNALFGKKALQYLANCPKDLSTASEEQRWLRGWVRDLYPAADQKRVEAEILQRVYQSYQGEVPIGSSLTVKEVTARYVIDNVPPYSRRFFDFLTWVYAIEGRYDEVGVMRRKMPAGLSGTDGSRTVAKLFETTIDKEFPRGLVRWCIDDAVEQYPLSERWEIRKKLNALVKPMDSEDFPKIRTAVGAFFKKNPIRRYGADQMIFDMGATDAQIESILNPFIKELLVSAVTGDRERRKAIQEQVIDQLDGIRHSLRYLPQSLEADIKLLSEKLSHQEDRLISINAALGVADVGLQVLLRLI